MKGSGRRGGFIQYGRPLRVFPRLVLDLCQRRALGLGLDDADCLTADEEHVISTAMASRQHELPYGHAGTSVKVHLVAGLYDPASCSKLLVNVLPGPGFTGQVVLITVCHDSVDYRPVMTAAELLASWEAPIARPTRPSPRKALRDRAAPVISSHDHHNQSRQ